MIRGKKGAEMTIGTLVVIVLAVLVLALLAFGFGTGWANLWEKIKGTAGTVNVDTLKQSCLYACTTQQTYSYCCENRTIIYQQPDGKIARQYGTCENDLIRPEGCTLGCDIAKVCGQATQTTPAVDGTK